MAAQKIKLVALDVDGVLTNGAICLGNNGEELKFFHVRDGLGIRMAQETGIIFAIITGRESEIVRRRAKELGILEVHQGVHDKWPVLQGLVTKYGLTMDQVAYVGDDLNDIAIIKSVGLGATVADGVPEVRKMAVYVSPLKGGHGAVRDILELILKAQDKWDGLVAKFIGEK